MPMPAKVLVVVFLVKFGLLFGWMPNWKTALVTTVIDWILGVAIYRWWIKPGAEADVPRCVPRIPSGIPDSSLRPAA